LTLIITKTDKLIEKYVAYHTSVIVKVLGYYKQAEVIEKVSAIGATPSKKRVYEKLIPNKVYKTGKWTYYNNNGNLIKIDNKG
jgi:hypothetical protein